MTLQRSSGGTASCCCLSLCHFLRVTPLSTVCLAPCQPLHFAHHVGSFGAVYFDSVVRWYDIATRTTTTGLGFILPYLSRIQCLSSPPTATGRGPNSGVDGRPCERIRLYPSSLYLRCLLPSTHQALNSMHPSGRPKPIFFPPKSYTLALRSSFGPLLSDTRGTRNGAWHIFTDDHDTMASMVQTA